MILAQGMRLARGLSRLCHTRLPGQHWGRERWGRGSRKGIEHREVGQCLALLGLAMAVAFSFDFPLADGRYQGGI